MAQAFIGVQVEGQTVIASYRTFSTGSQGFNGNGKLIIDGELYQASINLVKIGSKPAAAGGQSAAKMTPAGANGQHAADVRNGPAVSVKATK